MTGIENSELKKIILPEYFNTIQEKDKFFSVYEKIIEDNPYILNSSIDEQNKYFSAIKKWRESWAKTYANWVNNCENAILSIRHPQLRQGKSDTSIIWKIRGFTSTVQQKEYREAIKYIMRQKNELTNDEIKTICSYINQSKNISNFKTKNEIISELSNIILIQPEYNDVEEDTATALKDLKIHIWNVNMNTDTFNTEEEKEKEIIIINSVFEENVELSETFQNIESKLRQDDEIKDLNPTENQSRKATAFLLHISNKCSGITGISDENFDYIYEEIKCNYLHILKWEYCDIRKVSDTISAEILSDSNISILDIIKDFDNDDINIKWWENAELTQEDESKLKNLNLDPTSEEYIKIKNTFKKINTLEKNSQNLSPKEKMKLIELKSRIWIVTKVIAIKEFRAIQLWQRHNHPQYNEQNSPTNNIETTNWTSITNTKAIIEWNQSIQNFIYKPQKDKKDFINPQKIELSNENTKKYFEEIKQKNKNDKNFMDSIQYFDEYLQIDKQKAENDHVDINSLQKQKLNIQKEIEREIKRDNLNIQRQQTWKERREHNFEITRRKCIMTCCLNAISRFFDKWNLNGENFAEQFEIWNINSDINFNEDTQILKMSWTIGWNKNHIWLYYNLKTWELSFDNFLAKDPQWNWYIIGKWNWITEKLNIKLPTIDEMSRKINSNETLFNIFNSNKFQNYNWKLLNKIMMESVRFWCFNWFLWVNTDVNRQMIQEFNEKNILKQDIIKNIYSTYYDPESLNKICNEKLNINEWNTPEQYKLIKLISDSINNCRNANELLRFRNLINELNDILNNRTTDYVNKDSILSYLFADNKQNKNDQYDTSRKELTTENWNTDLTLNTESPIHQTNFSGTKETKSTWINYYTFLNLLAENKQWVDRYINLDTFSEVINTIKKDWTELKDIDKWLFKQNLENSELKQELADLVLNQKLNDLDNIYT